jgi:outer membrane protein
MPSHKSMGITALSLSLIIGISTGQAQTETLAEAIAMAYQNNPTIGRQRAFLRATDETYVQSRSSLGPSLSLGTSTNYTNTDQNPFGRSTRSRSSVSFLASQSLFASGALKSNLDAAKSLVFEGRENLRSVENQIIFNVISLYTAVRRDQEALRIAGESLKVFQRQLDETNARFKVGELTRTDVAQAEASFASAQANLAQRQANLDSNRAAYVAIVGQMPTALADVPDLAEVPANYETALDLAEKNNPDLKAAYHAEDSSRARVKSARSGLGPSVSLSGSYGGAGDTRDVNAIQVNAAQATLNVNVPLFASGFNGSRIRQASENLNAQKLQVEITRRSVIQDVSQAWANLVSARSSTLSNKSRVKSTAIAAEGVRYEAQAGLRTTIEALNAQLNFENAQLDLIEAQRNQYIAEGQLLLFTGQIDINKFDSQVKAYDPVRNFKKVKNSGALPSEIVVFGIDAAGAEVVDVVSPKD